MVQLGYAKVKVWSPSIQQGMSSVHVDLCKFIVVRNFNGVRVNGTGQYSGTIFTPKALNHNKLNLKMNLFYPP